MTTQPEPTSPALPPSLIAYLAQRDAQRADAVRTVLASLTDRERALIKDAAVMGYVRGTMHPKGERVPKDGEILAEAIDACIAFPDLYPAINAVSQQGIVPSATPEQARRVLTPDEYSAACHAVEAAAGEPGADPGTVLLAVLDRLGVQPPSTA
ncbi:hypothetical protein HUF15_00680 [Streptomyces samsunensis]|uniref:hypothetical protein n=1 Tax=Streptomyces malaysiensis TaxID=92644 RepID=UPI00158422BD|nr:hypothetical protein [Streptomyces samsunensis]NUH35296.1 hypothetical protein [Streptomyces samsunensis]